MEKEHTTTEAAFLQMERYITGKILSGLPTAAGVFRNDAYDVEDLKVYTQNREIPADNGSLLYESTTQVHFAESLLPLFYVIRCVPASDRDYGLLQSLPVTRETSRWYKNRQEYMERLTRAVVDIDAPGNFRDETVFYRSLCGNTVSSD